MKRRRLFLYTFLLSTAAGWAAAHFSVGNTGAIALRAAISEGRMAFSTTEKTAAAAQVSSLAGKSLAAQAEIIAQWANMTSLAGIRHLYAALDKVPHGLRDMARDILLDRWAMLDPDSLLLAAETWARYDLDAAQQWAQTLTGEGRTRAEHALQSAAADWSTPSTAADNR